MGGVQKVKRNPNIYDKIMQFILNLNIYTKCSCYQRDAFVLPPLLHSFHYSAAPLISLQHFKGSRKPNLLHVGTRLSIKYAPASVSTLTAQECVRQWTSSERGCSLRYSHISLWAMLPLITDDFNRKAVHKEKLSFCCAFTMTAKHHTTINTRKSCLT